MKKYTMKLSLKNSAIAMGVVALTTSAIAQKKNETSAAVEFKNKFLPAKFSGEFEDAKKSLLSAKEFIDLAAVHEETKNSAKTLWLKGDIYSNIILIGTQTMDTNFIKNVGENGLAISAYKQGYSVSTKYHDEIKSSITQNVILLDGVASMLYKNDQFNDAGELYETIYNFNDAINLMDSSSLFNASLCFEKALNYEKAAKGYGKLAKVNYRGTTSAVLASNAYRKSGNIEEAKAIINEARKQHPSDRELLLELVNTNIDAGDAAGAETALSEAIASDPKNKQLYYTIGTIYIDLKENEKAEASLMKALEIDPNYVDAQYQLGAHLVTWASDMKLEANQLKFGDPNYDLLMKKSEDLYKKAIIPLEKYIANYPKDKDVLKILSQLYRNIGNTEKALEYKRRLDEIGE
jgi:tetratricopeptide (TPR) repeat protein